MGLGRISKYRPRVRAIFRTHANGWVGHVGSRRKRLQLRRNAGRGQFFNRTLNPEIATGEV